MPEILLPLKKAVDHLLLGVPNLEAGIAWVEERTGVKAAPGGRHPGLGTHNALLSLDHQQYLEIIAPDPTQPMIAPQFAFLQLAVEPRLLTWAAVTNNIAAIVARAQVAGFALDGPNAGSRARPDGAMLHWKTLFLATGLGLQIPFFIEWDAASLHPSQDSPTGCTLQSFEMTSPQPENLRAALQQIGLDGDVHRGAEARLQAVIASPNGSIELG
jgi:Glyoxalase-like domain